MNSAQPNVVVCYDLADLIRLDPREAYAEEGYYEPLEPEVDCFYRGEPTRSPFRIGTLVFCCNGCGSDYAE